MVVEVRKGRVARLRTAYSLVQEDSDPVLNCLVRVDVLPKAAWAGSWLAGISPSIRGVAVGVYKNRASLASLYSQLRYAKRLVSMNLAGLAYR